MTLDPSTIMEGIPLLAAAARGGYARFRRWREGDNFERLKRLLTGRFENHEYLYGHDWSFLASDAEAAAILDEFFVSQQPLFPSLVPVIERHLSVVSDAASSTRQLAEEVVDGIEAVANEIWHEDVDRIIFELRRLVNPLGDLQATAEAIESRLAEMNVEVAPRVVSFSTAPDDIRGDLERLATENEVQAVRLYDALMAGASPGTVARNLIDAAPQWTSEAVGAGTLWHVLGRIAARYGMWDRAEAAYLRALDLGYARRAQALANAAEAAAVRGNDDRHRELLAQAAQEDASEPGVAILEAARLESGDARLERLESASEPTQEDAAAIWVARASAHLMEGRYSDARAAISHAVELNPRSLHAEEIGAVITLFEGRERMGGVVDVPALREAAVHAARICAVPRTVCSTPHRTLVRSLRHAQLTAAGAPRRPTTLTDDVVLMTGTLWHQFADDARRGRHLQIHDLSESLERPQQDDWFVREIASRFGSRDALSRASSHSRSASAGSARAGNTQYFTSIARPA
jgi:tetratricopeptide (TPR) repeat protein